MNRPESQRLSFVVSASLAQFSGDLFVAHAEDALTSGRHLDRRMLEVNWRILDLTALRFKCGRVLEALQLGPIKAGEALDFGIDPGFGVYRTAFRARELEPDTRRR